MRKYKALRKLSKTPPDTKTQNHPMEERERTPPPAEISSGADNSGAEEQGYIINQELLN